MEDVGVETQIQGHARSHATSRNCESPSTKIPIRRTRTGCTTCRSRKVKCDEKRPACSQCQKGKRLCDWSAPGKKRVQYSRRPNATSCITCREKKLKCVGDVTAPCGKCRMTGIKCVRALESIEPAPDDSGQQGYHSGATIRDAVSSSSLHVSSLRTRLDLPRASTGAELESQSSTQQQLTGHPPPFKAQLPSKSELEKLIQLYFSSVHHFGFLTFIHPLHFHRLLADGKAPRELTLIMIANAMRFAGEISSENLAKADAWADTAIEALLPRIYQGFGAIQLMTLLLAQHYDLNRGNFTSAWLLGANCTRMMQMMSLQAFDRTYPATFPPNLHLSPLLSCEALRRLAWSTFFMDSLVDGGRYGFHTVDENSYRLQLPCDQASFLANETVKTEMLFHHQNDPSSSTTNEHIQRGPLDMSAYLIRIAAARRRALHFAFRASHREETVERMTTELETLEEDIGAVVAELPKRFQFNADNMFIHRERLTTFIVLHILRHNLFIILGRAALLIYQRDPYKADLIVQVRQKRISHALPIASIIAEGLKADICFDTHVGIQAYVALEILLFEPRRLANIDSSVNLKSPELMKAIPYLLTVIRDLGHRSESVKQLHIEAVHRLLRCDFTHVMNQTDFNAFHSEYRLVGQDPAEYDFRDFRWAKLERIRRGARTVANNEGRNEALLEYQVDGEVTDQLVAPSPRLDAMDVNSAVNISCSSVSQSSHGLGLSLSTGASGSSNNTAMSAWHSPGPESQGQEFSFDWLWLLEESGQSIYQTGDPVTFWSQLQRI